MAEDRPLKSAFDLAMERLRQGDKDAGVESRPMTDAQKAAIAEVRNFYEAKLAEQQVLHQSTLKHTQDPAERAGLEENYRRDRERLGSERDAKIERIRKSP
jgi:LPS O-antigen subunit length determinant protein (WzzB/FepE family)